MKATIVQRQSLKIKEQEAEIKRLQEDNKILAAQLKNAVVKVGQLIGAEMDREKAS